MNPVIIIAGPTAVGKTEITLELAKQLDGEIISADSMQIYRRMDIGSAKPSARELAAVPHHLIDVVEPDQPFSVADFQRLATDAIRTIQKNGKTPIVSGGTGLYINSLLYEMDFSGTASDDSYRKVLEEFARTEGPEALYQRLVSQDPAGAAAIHPNNIKRVIRALEINEVGGSRKADFVRNPQRNMEFSFLFVCLTRPRAELYDRINQRVDLMLSAGLLAEVEQLRAAGLHRELQSMQGIGYKELLDCLEGHWSCEEAVNSIKQNSRNYAKRQLTWFKRYAEAHWLDLSCDRGTSEALKKITDLMQAIHSGGIL